MPVPYFGFLRIANSNQACVAATVAGTCTVVQVLAGTHTTHKIFNNIERQGEISQSKAKAKMYCQVKPPAFKPQKMCREALASCIYQRRLSAFLQKNHHKTDANSYDFILIDLSEN